MIQRWMGIQQKRSTNYTTNEKGEIAEKGKQEGNTTEWNTPQNQNS